MKTLPLTLAVILLLAACQKPAADDAATTTEAQADVTAIYNAAQKGYAAANDKTPYLHWQNFLIKESVFDVVEPFQVFPILAHKILSLSFLVFFGILCIKVVGEHARHV